MEHEQNSFEQLEQAIRRNVEDDAAEVLRQQAISQAWSSLKVKFHEGTPIFANCILNNTSELPNKIDSIVARLVKFDRKLKENGTDIGLARDDIFRLKRFNKGQGVEKQIDGLFIELIEQMINENKTRLRLVVVAGSKVNKRAASGDPIRPFFESGPLLRQVYELPRSESQIPSTPEEIDRALSQIETGSTQHQILVDMLAMSIDTVEKQASQREIAKEERGFAADERRSFKALVRLGAIHKGTSGTGYYLSALGGAVAERLRDCKE